MHDPNHNYIVYCQTRSRTLQIELQERVVKECTILNAEQNDIRTVQYFMQLTDIT